MFRGNKWAILIVSGFLLIGSSIEAQEAIEAKHQEQSIITFVELGSVNCIPCKQMQPVMESLEQKYADQINVVFYDVWKADQKHYASEYGIRLIPTQVFLDSSGLELMRHEGFFPEAEIDAFLVKQGLIAKQLNE